MNDTITTEFSVRYNYPTIFTDCVFDSENLTLASTLERLNEGRRHRVVFYVDSALATEQPTPTLVVSPGLIAKDEERPA